MAGTDPEVRVEEPGNGSVMEEGPWNVGRLILKHEPLRMRSDLVLQEQPQQGFELLGPVADVLAEFAAFSRNGPLLKVPDLNRIAVGIVALIPVATRPAGYQLLQSCLRSVTLYPEKTSDFSYQINYPKSSAREREIVINRLSKWSVAAQQQVLFQFTEPGSIPPPLRTTYAVRMELDYNTAFRSGAIKDPTAIWDELMAEVLNTLTEGEPVATEQKEDRS